MSSGIYSDHVSSACNCFSQPLDANTAGMASKHKITYLLS